MRLRHGALLRGGSDRETVGHAVGVATAGRRGRSGRTGTALLAARDARATRTTPTPNTNTTMRHPRVDPQPADLVRGVDAHVLEQEAGERVERCTYSANVWPFFSRQRCSTSSRMPTTSEAAERLVEERRLERRVLRVARRAGVAGAISSAHGSVVGFPNSSWLNQLPHRPIACASTSPGAMQSMTTERRQVAAPRDDDHRERAADHRAPDRRGRPPRSGTPAAGRPRRAGSR